MSISSRTPEGSPGRCPVCNQLFRLEPSLLTGDVVCPRCGALVWLGGYPPPRSNTFTRWVGLMLLTAILGSLGSLAWFFGSWSGLGGPQALLAFVLTVLLFGRRLHRWLHWLAWWARVR
jgi:hypothetical protein